MRINLLVDLSGTLHIGDVACPGAIAALEKIQRAIVTPPYSVKLRFCSEIGWQGDSKGNTTKESTQDLQKRLQKAGFSPTSIPKTSILTSLEACKALAVQKAWKPLLLLTPSAQSTFQADDRLCKEAFYPSVDVPPSKMNEVEKKQLKECDTIIVGLAPDLFNAEWMDEAFRILSSEYSKGEKQLVATHRGAYVAALEAASQRSSQDTLVCGKPSVTFFEACLDAMRKEDGTTTQDEEERNIIIGDDIEADLGGGAIEMGLERILVQTGKYREGDENRTSKAVQIFATFADFVDKELFAKAILSLPR